MYSTVHYTYTRSSSKHKMQNYFIKLLETVTVTVRAPIFFNQYLQYQGDKNRAAILVTHEKFQHVKRKRTVLMHSDLWWVPIWTCPWR